MTRSPSRIRIIEREASPDRWNQRHRGRTANPEVAMGNRIREVARVSVPRPDLAADDARDEDDHRATSLSGRRVLVPVPLQA